LFFLNKKWIFYYFEKMKKQRKQVPVFLPSFQTIQRLLEKKKEPTPESKPRNYEAGEQAYFNAKEWFQPYYELCILLN